MQVSPKQDFLEAGLCLIPSCHEQLPGFLPRFPCPVAAPGRGSRAHGVASLGLLWPPAGTHRLGCRRVCLYFLPFLCFLDGTPRSISLYRAKGTSGRLGGVE